MRYVWYRHPDGGQWVGPQWFASDGQVLTWINVVYVYSDHIVVKDQDGERVFVVQDRILYGRNESGVLRSVKLEERAKWYHGPR